MILFEIMAGADRGLFGNFQFHSFTFDLAKGNLDTSRLFDSYLIRRVWVGQRFGHFSGWHIDLDPQGRISIFEE